jgi:hypothetical protein
MLWITTMLGKKGIVAGFVVPYHHLMYRDHSRIAFASPPASTTWVNVADVACSQRASAVLKSGAFNSILYSGAPL